MASSRPLRRVRAAFGAIEIIEVVNHDLAAAPGESIEGQGWPTRGG